MTVKEIESAIVQLSEAELTKLANWFDEFQAQAWDRKIERDQKSGRLRAAMDQAQQRFESGRCQPL